MRIESLTMNAFLEPPTNYCAQIVDTHSGTLGERTNQIDALA